MPNHLFAGGMLDKGVPAVASVLDSAGAPRDRMHRVAEQAAQVSDLLGEAVAGRVRVAAARKQQRVPAVDAGVFGVTMTLARPFVGVVAEEARQRVPDANDRAIVAQARHPASGAGPSFRGENPVIDGVSPDPAYQLKHAYPLHQPMCQPPANRLIGRA